MHPIQCPPLATSTYSSDPQTSKKLKGHLQTLYSDKIRDHALGMRGHNQPLQCIPTRVCVRTNLHAQASKLMVTLSGHYAMLQSLQPDCKTNRPQVCIVPALAAHKSPTLVRTAEQRDKHGTRKIYSAEATTTTFHIPCISHPLHSKERTLKAPCRNALHA